MKKMRLHKNAEKGGNAYLTQVPIHCLRPHSLPSYASANAFVLLIRLLPTMMRIWNINNQKNKNKKSRKE